MATATVTRVTDLNAGDVWWQPVQEILDYWFSVDRARPARAATGHDSDLWTFEPWEAVIRAKRHDLEYNDIRASLSGGFKAPLNAIVRIDRNGWLGKRFPDRSEHPYPTFGDGHHRFAAAVELGFTHVLMCASLSDIVHHDVGWSRHNKIPKHP